MDLPGHVHLLRCGHAVRRARLLARQQHLQPAAFVLAAARFPTPGSPAAEDKEKRDHDNENKRRAAKGLPSIEEEKLIEAKQEAERKASQGHQRQQPQRKNRRKK